MDISSRTPEGLPNQCPLCGSGFSLSPSVNFFDAPCPNCGSLVWFAEKYEFLICVVDMSLIESVSLDWTMNNISVFVLDFSKVEQPSTSFLGKLITSERKCKAQGKSIKIAGLSSELKEMFSVTKLNKLLDLYEQPGDAMQDL